MFRKLVLPYSSEFLACNNGENINLSLDENNNVSLQENVEDVLANNDLIFSMYEKDLTEKIDKDLKSAFLENKIAKK